MPQPAFYDLLVILLYPRRLGLVQVERLDAMEGSNLSFYVLSLPAHEWDLVIYSFFMLRPSQLYNSFSWDINITLKLENYFSPEPTGSGDEFGKDG